MSCGCQERANRLAAGLRAVGLRGLAAGFESQPTRTLVRVATMIGGVVLVLAFAVSQAAGLTAAEGGDDDGD